MFRRIKDAVHKHDKFERSRDESNQIVSDDKNFLDLKPNYISNCIMKGKKKDN